MTSLQIREFHEVLYGELKRAAEREHRSLSQQALVVLKRGLRMEKDSKERRSRLLNEITKNPITIEGDGLLDPTTLIREDRNR